MKSASLAGIIVVLVGLIAGLSLVRNEQDIRRSAKEEKEHKVTICHKTGSESNPWVQIEVAESATKAHLDHGDIQGNCPSQEKPEDKKSDNNGGGGQGGNSSNSVTLASNVTVINDSQTPAPTAEIRYVYVTTKIDFWIKFQGIDELKPNKNVRVIFRMGDEELHVYNHVPVTADRHGIYKGTLTDIRPGVYDVLIKGDGYLQRKFENVDLKRGSNSYHWENEELLAGDFNLDNKLELSDIAELLSVYQDSLPEGINVLGIFDVNMDGKLDEVDIDIILSNYHDFVLEGDN